MRGFGGYFITNVRDRRKYDKYYGTTKTRDRGYKNTEKKNKKIVKNAGGEEDVKYACMRVFCEASADENVVK